MGGEERKLLDFMPLGARSCIILTYLLQEVGEERGHITEPDLYLPLGRIGLGAHVAAHYSSQCYIAITLRY